MRVLVTGVRGLAGSFLTEFLLSKKGIEVHGLGRPFSKNVFGQKISKDIIFHPCDICDAKTVNQVIKKVRPERLFHLAAQSSASLSWDFPANTLQTNIIGQLNIFEAVRRSGQNPRIHIAGSSDVYGIVDASQSPIRETVCLKPVSPYGVSKAAQDLLAYQYYKAYGLPIVRTRAFNHTGPGQNETFVASNFAKQFALIEAGKEKPVIHTGDLETVRDFTDVRDIVKAYWLAIEKGKPGEAYNVCSGHGRKIREIIEFYLKQVRAKIKIELDSSRIRPGDTPVLVGDSSKFRKETGWKPVIPFETTLTDLLNAWRQTVAGFTQPLQCGDLHL